MSKTQTVVKPSSAKASQAAKASRKAQGKPADKAQETQQAAPQAAPVVSQAAPQETQQATPSAPSYASAPSMPLYHFNQTPTGRKLRAFFIAYVCAQIGEIAAGRVFRLWPHANISGHLKSGKVERKADGYAFTVPGVNYFTDPQQAADKDLLAGMSDAVKNGTAPQFYRFMTIKTGAAK